MNHQKYFKDLQFYVVATPHSHYVDYAIYDIEGEYSDETPLFHKKGSITSPDPVEEIENAEPYLHGSVKWDGCSDWHFDAQEGVMLHGCSRNDISRFGEVMARCWDWTQDLCENWDPC
jgi:hypothetical protein